MKKLLTAIKWDAILIYKYGIVAIAAIVTAIYSTVFLTTNTNGLEKLVTVLVFSDPVMYGFLFTAVMILFEKESQTHQAIAVSPLTSMQYILSKTITFTVLALCCGLTVILAAQPQHFNLALFILATILSAMLFVFIGIIGVAYVKSFNQFILLMPIVLGPVCLPFLSYFSIVNSDLFYLIPTQACLILFEASVLPVNQLDIAYAIIYLIIWILFCYPIALRTYKRKILNMVSHE